MTFEKRFIDLSFTLGKGEFGADGFDTVALSGRRVHAHISQEGGASAAALEMRVFGVPKDVMDHLTILGQFAGTSQLEQNTVSVLPMGGLAFKGVITECWVDAANSPEVSLVVIANVAALDSLVPAPPSSFRGPITVDLLLSNIAQRLKPPRQLQNNGVNVTLHDTYKSGTYLRQIQDICADANCDYSFDPVRMELVICPKNAAVNGPQPRIAADSGLVGYPVHTQKGVNITTLYNPALSIMQAIQLESIFPAANGQWRIYNISHELESETPGGAWFTHFDADAYNRT